MMFPKNLPDDINVELLLDYLPIGSSKLVMKGLHKRNTYNDLLDLEEHESFHVIGVGRRSIYHSLPEYIFHPVDRFNHLPRLEYKERFTEELEKQEQEKESARLFFAPVDIQLLLYRLSIRRKLQPYYERNKVLLEILGDRLSDSQKRNRFIQKAQTFMPSFKTMRGNKTLITLLLRKIFFDEGMDIQVSEQPTVSSDPSPRYDDGIGGILNDCYAGNVYDDMVVVYDIHYWSEEDCDEYFLQFVCEVDEFRHFVEDYLLAVGEQLIFDISHDGPALHLSDDAVYHYLDYNTNI